MQLPTKILVIKPSSLGDIIHGLQVVASIKEQLPSAKIDWAVRDCFSRMVEASGIADRLYLFHRHGGLRKFLKLIFEIRQAKYDYVLDMQGLARSGILTYFAHADRKIGRSDAREFAWLAYDKKIKFPSQQTPHAIDILLQFLTELGLENVLSSNLKFSATPSTNVLIAFEKCIANSNGNLPILVFPESRRKEKEWPHFQCLTETLSQKFKNYQIIVIGQNKIDTSYAKNVFNLSGQTTLDDMIFLVQHASVVVANDSAPMHLAAAVGTPVVALFGPTDHRKFGPYTKNSPAKVLQATDHNIENIGINEVLTAIDELLASGQ